MKRVILILTAVVLATAAPLRAWCEADCLAPAHTERTTSASHCQPSEPEGGTTSMSARMIADCPIVESARPVTVVKLAFAPAIAPQYLGIPASGHLGTTLRLRASKAARPSGTTPLRI